MSTETPRDQPSDVSVEDAPRAPDESVVTSDTPPEADAAASSDSPSAAGKPAGAKDPSSQPGDAKPRPKRDRSSERRFGRLKRKLAKADERNTTNESRIADLEKTVKDLQAAPVAKGPEPKLEDYPNPQAYAKAYAKWNTETKAPTSATPRETPPAGKPAAKPASKQPPEPAFEDKEIADFNAKGAKKFGDEFLEAMQDEDTAVNLTMGEFIFDSEYGPDIYLHLANNQAESRKIFDSSAPRAIKALEALEEKAKKGELDIPEGQLQVEDPPDPGDPDAGKAKAKAAGGKRPGKTKAPEPPSDTKGGTHTPPKSPEDESMDEYAARREREERKRAGLPPL